MFGLAVEHRACVLQHLCSLVGRELHGAVLIHVDQIAGRDIHAAHRDRHIDRMHRHFAVAGGDAAQEQLEIQPTHSVDVARRAVRQHADTTDRFHGRHHDLAGQAGFGHQRRRPFLLDDKDGRLLHGVQRIHDVHEAEPPSVVGVRQAVDAGDRVADDRTHLGVDAADRSVGVPVLGPGIVQPEAERVVRVGRHHVGDGRRVDLAQLGKYIVGLWRRDHGLSPFLKDRHMRSRSSTPIHLPRHSDWQVAAIRAAEPAGADRRWSILGQIVTLQQRCRLGCRTPKRYLHGGHAQQK